MNIYNVRYRYRADCEDIVLLAALIANEDYEPETLQEELNKAFPEVDFTVFRADIVKSPQGTSDELDFIKGEFRFLIDEAKGVGLSPSDENQAEPGPEPTRVPALSFRNFIDSLTDLDVRLRQKENP